MGRPRSAPRSLIAVAKYALPRQIKPRGGEGGTPYNGLYGEVPPERGYLFQASGLEKGRDFTSWGI